MQDVVGLGGSARSIEALKTFFSYMPEDSGLAFVVVLHLSPEYESCLRGVLQKWTSMPVIQVSEPIKVEANSVYVIPPRKHLLMADRHLILTVLPLSTANALQWIFSFARWPKRTAPVRPL
jgi:two-component system CheB/CheR fusion protein